MFPSSFRNTSGSLGERETAVGEQRCGRAIVSLTASSSFPKPVFIFNLIETRRTCFLLLWEDIATKKRLHDCSRHHYVNSSFSESSVSLSWILTVNTSHFDNQMSFFSIPTHLFNVCYNKTTSKLRTSTLSSFKKSVPINFQIILSKRFL